MLVDEVQYFPISLSEFSWISSMITLGCAISCLPVGLLMNKYGRKTTMLSLVLPFTIGWVLVIWAQNFTMMCIGRLLIGIAGGAFCIAAPQYTAEIAEKEIRGTLSSFFQLMMVTGILFVYCVGAGLDVIWFSVIGLIIPLVFGCIFFIMPESPTYLVNEGKVDAAIVSFKWLRGQSYDPSIEIDNLKAELLEKNQNDMSFIDTLKLTANKKALLIGFGLMFFQQLSGVNIVIFYVSDIFKVLSLNYILVLYNSFIFLDLWLRIESRFGSNYRGINACTGNWCFSNRCGPTWTKATSNHLHFRSNFVLGASRNLLLHVGSRCIQRIEYWMASHIILISLHHRIRSWIWTSSMGDARRSLFKRNEAICESIIGSIQLVFGFLDHLLFPRAF